MNTDKHSSNPFTEFRLHIVPRLICTKTMKQKRISNCMRQDMPKDMINALAKNKGRITAIVKWLQQNSNMTLGQTRDWFVAMNNKYIK